MHITKHTWIIHVATRKPNFFLDLQLSAWIKVLVSSTSEVYSYKNHRSGRALHHGPLTDQKHLAASVNLPKPPSIGGSEQLRRPAIVALWVTHSVVESTTAPLSLSADVPQPIIQYLWRHFWPMAQFSTACHGWATSRLLRGHDSSPHCFSPPWPIYGHRRTFSLYVHAGLPTERHVQELQCISKAECKATNTGNKQDVSLLCMSGFEFQKKQTQITLQETVDSLSADAT